MKTIKKISVYVLLGTICLPLLSCESFLDIKPDQKLAVPASLDDLQALMDDHLSLIIESNAGAISADDYTLSDEDLSSLSSDFHRRMYYWYGQNLFPEGSASNDWGRYYSIIYNSNTVLEGLEKIEKNSRNANQYDEIKGRALFLRAQKLFNASLIWCNVYDPKTADQQLGMPIKLSSDFNKVSSRSTLEETFIQVLQDAEKAVYLLPEKTSHPIEPGRAANYTLLARIHLYMGNYEKSFHYADSALALKSDLIDYNTLDQNINYPIPQFNEETILYSQIASQQILNLSRSRVIKELVESFEEDDLRKTLFFSENADGSYGFRGRYTGSVSLFMGYATDELFLIRAESATRIGKKDLALRDMNTLLTTRWKKTGEESSYKPMESMSEASLLDFILKERRKTLIFRGLRWYDIKRLNRDGADITLKRTVEGKEYTLPPNDNRYALPIPEDIVRLSDIIQNPR